jgi:hypothetical protein
MAKTKTKTTAKTKGDEAEEGTQLVAFRMSPDLVRQLDAHALKMASQMPGVRFTRTQAVLSLLTKALVSGQGG